MQTTALILIASFILTACNLGYSTQSIEQPIRDHQSSVTNSESPEAIPENPTFTRYEWYFGDCMEQTGDRVRVNDSLNCQVMDQRYNLTTDICAQELSCDGPSQELAAHVADSSSCELIEDDANTQCDPTDFIE